MARKKSVLDIWEEAHDSYGKEDEWETRGVYLDPAENDLYREIKLRNYYKERGLF
ncbi:hypothetical protein [Geoglobus ahangari]